MITLLWFVLILGVIVLVHEFGHFIWSKIFGVYVHEFAIGMGPKLLHYKKKGAETEYSIRAIPLGGFCALAGEEEDIEQDKKIPKDRLLCNKPVWQRCIIMIAGVANNFILAILLVFLIGMTYGGANLDPIISSVDENFPAYEAGIEKGDRVLKVNGENVYVLDDVSIYIQLADLSKPVTLEVKKKNGEVKVYEVIPKEVKEYDEEGNESISYKIGIGLENEVRHTFKAALKYTYQKTISMFHQMVITFKYLFTGRVSFGNLSGPVGIYNIVGSQRASGFVNLVYLTALLSVNVGFINLIPIPAFDGGRVLFLIIEKITGKKINGNIEAALINISFILLFLLMIIITINDIFHLW